MRIGSSIHKKTTYSSMSEFDIQRVTGNRSDGPHSVFSSHLSYRSDSVMSRTVSQVSNPSSRKLSRYCWRPRRSKMGPIPVI